MLNVGDFVDISVVIPAFNEEDTIKDTIERTNRVLHDLDKTFEIIIINDKSSDSTGFIVSKLQKEFQNLILLENIVNKGKSASLNRGFKVTKGSVIIMMDADLQQIPEDIPLLLDKLNEGYDLVNGWRKKRNDPFSKLIVSRIYNSLSRFIFKTKIHDMNCGFKAIRKEVLDEITLKPDYFRYLAVLALSEGFIISEVAIRHFDRKHGQSNYGPKRMFDMVDLISIKLKLIFSKKPMLLFGSISAILLTTGIIEGIYLAILKFVFNQPIGVHIPLLFLSTLSIITGIMFISIGFLADLIKDLEYKLKRSNN